MGKEGGKAAEASAPADADKKGGASTVSPLSSGLLLPDAVRRIAAEGIAIRWDPTEGCYEVLDGVLFEQKIEGLRRKRDREGGDSGRPFSRMHKYYTLESGIGWAKTGAFFKPKSSNLVRRPGPVAAAPIVQPVAGQPTLAQALVANAVGPAGLPGPSASPFPNWASQAQISQAVDIGVNRLVQAAEAAFLQAPSFDATAQLAKAEEAGAKRARVEDLMSSNSSGANPYVFNAQTPTAALKGVSAENVNVRLTKPKASAPYETEEVMVTLQQYLDTIEAGAKYARILAANTQRPSPSHASAPHSSAIPNPTPCASANTAAAPGRNGSSDGVGGDSQGGQGRGLGEEEGSSSDGEGRHSPNSLSEVDLQFVGHGYHHPDLMLAGDDPWSLWSETCKGDMAYFFPRANQCPQPFFNGSIVALRNGCLMPAGPDPLEKGDLLMVVSDLNAKWKGPAPSQEQEKLGHWCAYLGQVSLRVRGKVDAGQYLGPAGDGSGLAIPAVPGQQPVIAVALESKPQETSGLVKALVSVSLNALHHMPSGLNPPNTMHKTIVESVERAAVEAVRANKEADLARADASFALEEVSHLKDSMKGMQETISALQHELSKHLSGPEDEISRRSWRRCTDVEKDDRAGVWIRFDQAMRSNPRHSEKRSSGGQRSKLALGKVEDSVQEGAKILWIMILSFLFSRACSLTVALYPPVPPEVEDFMALVALPLLLSPIWTVLSAYDALIEQRNDASKCSSAGQAMEMSRANAHSRQQPWKEVSWLFLGYVVLGLMAWCESQGTGRTLPLLPLLLLAVVLRHLLPYFLPDSGLRITITIPPSAHLSQARHRNASMLV